MRARRWIIAAMILAVVAAGSLALLHSGGSDTAVWSLDLRSGEELLDEPIPYRLGGDPVYLIVTYTRALVVDASDGSVLGETPLEGMNAGLGHRMDPLEVYVGRMGDDMKVDVYRVTLDGVKPVVEGPLLRGVEPWSSFSDRGLWRARNGSLVFHPLPGLEPVEVESPLPFRDPISLSAHSVGPFDAVSIVLRNASMFSIIFDMSGDPRPVSVIRGYVVADVLESERGLFLLGVAYSGDNIAQYSIAYLIDVYEIMEDGMLRTFYGLTHRNVVNYPPAIEFYDDPLYLVLLSVGPKSRTGNFTGTDPAVVVIERDGDTVMLQYLADLVGELPPKTLWTPYTGLANPTDLDGDGLVDILASIKLYEGEEWRIRLVHLEMERPGTGG